MNIVQRPLPYGDYWPRSHPRAGERTPDQRPTRIIVHGMAWKVIDNGETIYAATLLGRLRLSAHLLGAPDKAGTVIRCRKDHRMAWHAKGYNEGSLGYEFLVPECSNYAEFLERIERPWIRTNTRQWASGVHAVAEWCSMWNIAPEPGTLDRHSDVDPERKRDPGDGFPWDRFVSDVREAI